MEPNQDTTGVSGADTAGQNGINQSVTEELVASVTAESANGGNMMAESGEKKKGGNGMLIGLILCLILAIGGIGFGIWAMMDGNSQVAERDKQIANLNQQLAEKVQTVVDNTTVVDAETGDDGKNETSVDPTDYIYVGEWGIKIKKPDNWRDIIKGYAFYNDYPQAVDTFEIMYSSDGTVPRALLSPLNVTCEDAMLGYDKCFQVGDKTIAVTLPSVEVIEVPEAFRAWITDVSNYFEE